MKRVDSIKRALTLALVSLALVSLALGQATAARPSLNAPDVITHGPRTIGAGGQKRVALTFDADMTPGMEGELRRRQVRSFDNEAVVNVLENTHTPATFFLTGMWAQVYPASARALAGNPLFEIENHSYDHPGFSQPCYGLARVAQASKRPDLLRAQRAIQQATGVTPRYFRFPGGCAAAGDVKLAQQMGLQVVHWDVIGGDVNQPSPALIARKTLAEVRDGSIVVLHVSGGHAPATGQALPASIAGLRARGYQLVTVRTLLGPWRNGHETVVSARERSYGPNRSVIGLALAASRNGGSPQPSCKVRSSE